jgi:hypothetical protein
MAGFIQRIRKKYSVYFRRKKQAIYQLIYKRLPLYYTNWNKIPLLNWWEVQKGNIEYINKYGLKVKLPFLYNVYKSILFQADKLDLRIIRKEAEYEILRSIAALTGDKMIEFEAGILKVQLKEDLEKIPENSGTMNDFIDYIELTLNTPGSINPEKTSAGRAYSLHHRAVEINRKREQLKRNGKHNKK